MSCIANAISKIEEAILQFPYVATSISVRENAAI